MYYHDSTCNPSPTRHPAVNSATDTGGLGHVVAELGSRFRGGASSCGAGVMRSSGLGEYEFIGLIGRCGEWPKCEAPRDGRYALLR